MSNKILFTMFTFDKAGNEVGTTFPSEQVPDLIKKLELKIAAGELPITNVLQSELFKDILRPSSAEALVVKPETVIGRVTSVKYVPELKILLGVGELFSYELYRDLGGDGCDLNPNLHYRILNRTIHTDQSTRLRITDVTAWDLDCVSAKLYAEEVQRLKGIR